MRAQHPGPARTARFWEPEEHGAVRCTLCEHRCRIPPGRAGLCGPRRNVQGTLRAESWGQVSALALDTIEKKPLRRFHPGSLILSAGSWGCNMRCPFCQNHEIAAGRPDCHALTPGGLAARALALAGEGNIGVAYTYNEPLVGVEFVLDCAPLVRANGQRNVMVSNGQVREEPLGKLLPLIDAWNIDLKSFTREGYRALGGELEATLRTIRLAAGVSHVEVTALIVPGLNDSPEEMRRLVGWLAGVRPDIPLHVSRSFPRHLSTAPATPVETVHRLAELAREHLAHVYTGNC